MTILVPSIVETIERQIVWTEIDPTDAAVSEAAEWLNEDSIYMHDALKAARTIGYGCIAGVPHESDWTHIYDACHGPWRPGEPEHYGWTLTPEGRWRDTRWDDHKAS